MALIVNFSDIFSSLITNKNSLFFVGKLEVPSYTVYGVSIKDFLNLEEAETCAEEVKKQGGAGFVYENGEKFVLLFGYQNLIEAKEIQANFIELGYNSRIVNLKVDAISNKYTGENETQIKNSLTLFRTFYQELSDATIDFDKESISRNQINSVIAKNITNISSAVNDLANIKDNYDLNYKNIILQKLKSLEEMAESLLYSKEDDLLFTSSLKEACIKIVLENQDMNKNINKI